MFPWFTEDSDPATPGDQGLSTGVTHAWDYLSYHGILEVPGTYYIPKIAIIDIGFDLDPTTGIPMNGNLDYGTLGRAHAMGRRGPRLPGRRARRRAR